MNMVLIVPERKLFDRDTTGTHYTLDPSEGIIYMLISALHMPS